MIDTTQFIIEPRDIEAHKVIERTVEAMGEMGSRMDLTSAWYMGIYGKYEMFVAFRNEADALQFKLMFHDIIKRVRTFQVKFYD